MVVAKLSWNQLCLIPKALLQYEPLDHSVLLANRLDGVGVKVKGCKVQLDSLEHELAHENFSLLPGSHYLRGSWVLAGDCMAACLCRKASGRMCHRHTV